MQFQRLDLSAIVPAEHVARAVLEGETVVFFVPPALTLDLALAEEFFLILNYELLYRDLAQVLALAPDLVILDEAQRIL